MKSSGCSNWLRHYHLCLNLFFCGRGIFAQVVEYAELIDIKHFIDIKQDGEAVFNLRCPGGPPVLRESFGLSVRELNRIANRIGNELALLCKAWKEHHDDY